MPHPTGPTDEKARKLIAELRRKRDGFYLDVARQLEKSRRSKKPVNIQKLRRLSGKHDSFVVPGRVLGLGELTKPLNVYAFSFSSEARNKIKKAGGKALPLSQILKDDYAPVKARMVI